MNVKPPQKTQHHILILGDVRSDFDEHFEYLNLPDFRADFMTDPRAFLKIIQNQVPIACILDLDAKDTKVIKALLLALRKVYGTGMLVFAATRMQEGELIDFVHENEITSIIPKACDKETFNKKLIDVVRRVYAPVKQKKSEFPEIVNWYFEIISPALAKISTGREEIDEPETRLNFYIEKLAPLRDPITTMVQSMAKQKDKLHFQQALRLYGFDNCRDLLISLNLGESLKVQIMKFDEKTGKLAPEPKNILQYAIKAYNTFADEGRYKNIAYNCGLVFDFFNTLNETSKEKNPAIKKIIETRFTDALGRVREKLKAAKGVTDLALEKHILTYIFMKEAGKIMMTFFYKDYADYVAKAEKKSLKPTLFYLAEHSKYSITHEFVGSLLAQVVPGLSDASQSILFSGQVPLLTGLKSDHNSYTLAAFCNG